MARMSASKDGRLARLVTCIALGQWESLSQLRLAAPAGEPDREWREAFLMAHLFASFPRSVEAGFVLNQAGGLGPPSAEELEEAADPRPGGLALFEEIYSEQSKAVKAALHSIHPLLETWTLGHAYGRVLARPGLAAARRELLATAALAALGLGRQLHSHMRGAMRCGATREQVSAIITSVADLLEPQRLQDAKELIARLDPRT